MMHLFYLYVLLIVNGGFIMSFSHLSLDDRFFIQLFYRLFLLVDDIVVNSFVVKEKESNLIIDGKTNFYFTPYIVEFNFSL